MHYVYILHSKSINKFYIGYSQNPITRLQFHNSELNKIWSQRGKPWSLEITFPFNDKKDALRTEKKSYCSSYTLRIFEMFSKRKSLFQFEPLVNINI